MKQLIIALCAACLIAICSCGTAPPKSMDRPPGVLPRTPSGKVIMPPPDYTKDWRKIADKGGKTKYPTYVTELLWNRLNWRKNLSGEWIDEMIEDYQRLYRWRKKLADWTAEKGNPEWEY